MFVSWGYELHIVDNETRGINQRIAITQVGTLTTLSIDINQRKQKQMGAEKKQL